MTFALFIPQQHPEEVSPLRSGLRAALAAGVPALILAAFLGSGCMSRATGGSQQDMATLGRVTRGRLAVTVSATGQVVAAQAQEVNIETSGTVVSVLAHEGGGVEAGQVLAELENPDLVTQAALARLDVSDAESNIAELESQGQIEGGVLRRELRADAAARVVSLAAGMARSAQVRAGGPILTLAAVDRIELVVEVTPPERQQISVGCPAVVWPKDYTGSMDGRVAWISDHPVASAEAYGYQVGVAVDRPGLIREGGKASADIRGPAATVVREGTFRWADPQVVSAPFDGTLARLEVQAGDIVPAGQLLAVVESDQGAKQLESLRRDLERKRLLLGQREESLAGLRIVAPAAGVLSGFTPQTGQRLQAGQALGRVLAEGPPEVEATVDETQVAQVRDGLGAEVTLEAFPGRTFKGRVTRVAMEGQSTGGTASYPTRVALEESAPGIRPGMTAQVSILVAEKAGVLLVPVEALVEAGGRVMVRVPAPQGENPPFSVQTVEIGLRSETQAEVVSGLAEGDTIVVALYSPGDESSPFMMMRPGGGFERPRRVEGGQQGTSGTRSSGEGGGGGGQ